MKFTANLLSSEKSFSTGKFWHAALQRWKNCRKLICFLSYSSDSHGVPPERTAPQGKWTSLAAGKMLALSIPRMRHCELLTQTF